MGIKELAATSPSYVRSHDLHIHSCEKGKRWQKTHISSQTLDLWFLPLFGKATEMLLGLCSNWICRNCQDSSGQYFWKKKNCCQEIHICKLLKRFTSTFQMYEKPYFKRLCHRFYHFTFLSLGQSQQ